MLPLLVLVLVAGCSGAPEADDPDPTGTPSVSPPSVSSSPTAVPPAVESEREDLADLAEKAATEAPSATVAPYPAPVLGGDISWPQCPKGLGIPEKRTLGMPMPLPQARYVVVGLTNGPGFHVNPCLADQVAWVRERRLLVSAYAVASFPQGDELARYGQDGPYDGGSKLDALRNVGYQQALFNVASMKDARLQTPFVWVDVEPVPDFPWSSDLVANAAVVEGAARGYVDGGYAIGVYSTPALWEGVVGGLELGVPEWRAAGETSRAEAESRCGDDWVIQGGPAVLAQWVEADRDQNITCGEAHLDLGAWFHQY
ncbi:hypothetical protein [Nocardioides sp. cx-173]|uniref:hypothetical protein n=1 Tax=Nocardioides sp. cx-173 TaxID=2898796 RepID=UPI001E63B735|nr:hypothetical protein [Nocardioides sp. cx-173]MCD4525145.1 hypothetical protein [Nocardioides sp. cx-173]UGB40153.1 hypothetical protein LQ940_12180 [Nocardioides sp. cx-173]